MYNGRTRATVVYLWRRHARARERAHARRPDINLPPPLERWLREWFPTRNRITPQRLRESPDSKTLIHARETLVTRRRRGRRGKVVQTLIEHLCSGVLDHSVKKNWRQIEYIDVAASEKLTRTSRKLSVVSRINPLVTMAPIDAQFISVRWNDRRLQANVIDNNCKKKIFQTKSREF